MALEQLDRLGVAWMPPAGAFAASPLGRMAALRNRRHEGVAAAGLAGSELVLGRRRRRRRDPVVPSL